MRLANRADIDSAGGWGGPQRYCRSTLAAAKTWTRTMKFRRWYMCNGVDDACNAHTGACRCILPWPGGRLVRERELLVTVYRHKAISPSRRLPPHAVIGRRAWDLLDCQSRTSVPGICALRVSVRCEEAGNMTATTTDPLSLQEVITRTISILRLCYWSRRKRPFL